jgi:DNA invertase Pin-like site-specific DNA recombinase
VNARPKVAAIYARVSTKATGSGKEQSVENQLRELRAVARRMGWKLDGEYVDKGISGAKGRDGRPAFDRMLSAAARREFDIVMAWSVDRLGRSLQHLVGFLGEIHGKGIDLYLHTQGVDTSTPGGKALFGMMGVFAEFERAMIQERIRAGLARAKAQGKQLGRPRIEAAVERQIHQGRAKGQGIREIARAVGVGPATVLRVLERN